MAEILARMVFGWPAIITALLVSAAGLIWKRSWLLLIGALVFFPVSLYLNGNPKMRGLAVLLPVMLLGAAIAVRVKRQTLAWIMALPVYAVSAWLAILVLTQ